MNCFSGFSVFVVNLWNPLWQDYSASRVYRPSPRFGRDRDHLPPTLPPPRAHKVADAEVPEDHQHRYGDQQLRVARAMRAPGRPQTHHCCQRKQGKDPEEDARNLQPKHSGEAHERPPHRFAEAPGSVPQSPVLLPRLGHRPCGYSSGTGNWGWPRLHCCRCARPASRRVWARWRHRRCLTAVCARVRALARRILRRGRVHRCHQRLHRVPRSIAKRPAKANPVHAGSLAFPPHPVKARFSSAPQSTEFTRPRVLGETCIAPRPSKKMKGMARMVRSKTLHRLGLANCRCGGLHPRGMLDHKLADSSGMPFPALQGGEYPLRPNRNPRRHGGGH